MIRRLAAMLLLLTLAASVWADRLVLLDGRSFTGIVTVQEDTVLIEMGYGTLEFSRDQVANIEFADTPELMLAGRLSEVDREDPDELFEIALWAEQNDLARRARGLFRQVIELDDDHAGARSALGYVHADGRWRNAEQTLQLARGKLEAGRHHELLEDLLPKLESVVTDPEHEQELLYLSAHALLRSGQFAGAADAFRRLAEKTQPPCEAKYAAIQKLLETNPDGMYVLTESYPPQSSLLDNAGSEMAPGPASLTEPRVLSAALRDRAIKEIHRGRDEMDEARKLAESDPEAARARWFQATRAFDRADAMVPEIARSYRVEMARQRIAQLRKEVEAGARRFDETLDTLGEEEMTSREYNALVRRMIRHLDTVREDLRDIIQLTEPYPQELVMESQWAQGDLERIESMRRTLTNELHGKN